MERIDVNGPATHDVYRFLRMTNEGGSSALGEPIEWNFTKFVVGRDGQVLKQFGQDVKPKYLDEQLPAWLA